MKLSPFGEFTRNLRARENEKLKDMSRRIGVNLSYLSAVELGKRNVPLTWGNLIAQEYSLNDIEKEELEHSIAYSRNTFIIKAENLNNEDKDLILALAKKMTYLSHDEKLQIKNILLNA